MKNRTSSTLMHQSIPAAPSPSPGILRGICPPCQSREWGICNFCAARRPGICQTRGHSRAFDAHAVFLSEYNYTEDFTGKETGLICQGQRVVKACSWFYACISSLLIKHAELHTTKLGAIDVNQRFLVTESNFCWYYLKKHPFIFIKLFITHNFTALYLF